jgi:Rps23 Pro-64 3,4-dihydroxylase Tpa1-like proline 4-hydroxylase
MEGQIKIYPENLNNLNNELINSINIDNLKDKFINAKPFSYVVIDNFLKEEYAEELYNNYPTITSEWHKYNNPLEKKYAYDNLSEMSPIYKDFFYYLNSELILNKIREFTDIPNLEYDPYLHGAGIHAMPNKGRLHMHLDYEKHPYSGKERRLNLIYFMNKEWNKEWGGELEFWDDTLLTTPINNNINEEIENKKVHIEPIYNRAVFFKTNDISWHGIPKVINCPNDKLRKSIACYWISDLNSNKNYYRSKAKFIKRPWETDELNYLYKIREQRRLTNLDFSTNIIDIHI